MPLHSDWTRALLHLNSSTFYKKTWLESSTYIIHFTFSNFLYAWNVSGICIIEMSWIWIMILERQLHFSNVEKQFENIARRLTSKKFEWSLNNQRKKAYETWVAQQGYCCFWWGSSWSQRPKIGHHEQTWNIFHDC